MQKRYFLSFIPGIPLYLLTFLLLPFFSPSVSKADVKINVTQIKDSGSSPFWSPDGKEIAYIYKGGLFIISSSGSGNEKKIVSGNVKLPRWSPDGKYIAYVDRYGLKIISPHGSEQPRLIYPDNNIQMPVWSANSKWIAFYLADLQGLKGSGVFTVHINTRKTRQISYSGINPGWSGDGKNIFYFVENDGNSFGQLYSANMETGEIKKIAPVGAECMNYNKEGTLLAFAYKQKGGSGLSSDGVFLASLLNEGEVRKISDDGYFPSFSYDDKYLSFFKFDPDVKKTKIYITQPTGNEIIEVGHGIYSRWAFNKKALVYEVIGVKGGIYVAEISD